MAQTITNQIALKNSIIDKSNLETVLNILKELIVISIKYE